MANKKGSGGLLCPKCGCKTKVERTDLINSGRIRVRKHKCTKCGYTDTTAEHF